MHVSHPGTARGYGTAYGPDPTTYLAMTSSPTVRIAAIGLNHAHIYSMVTVLLEAGAELVAFHSAETDLAGSFAAAHPQANRAGSQKEILEDPSIDLILSAAIPSDRPGIGLEAMRNGKDFLSDKPAFTTLAQLAEVRGVQAETGRIYSICYSERLLHRATQKAAEIVRSGAIGRAVQTVGLGPHRIGLHPRPDWFFARERYGGILCDIGAHQTDQFLYFTGSTSAEVVSAHVGNHKFPCHPGLDDFGEALFRGDQGTGYFRVDWYSPDGLGTWGDGRLIVLGTEGYVEVRKNCDIGARPGGDHLFMVDSASVRHVDCGAEELTFGADLLRDVIQRTETAMSQKHCFLASELALRAQAAASRLVTSLAGPFNLPGKPS